MTNPATFANLVHFPELGTVFAISTPLGPGEITRSEASLKVLTQNDQRVDLLQLSPDIGIMTSTALVASVGNRHRFSNSRKLASWMGFTLSERNSGNRRRLGAISDRGESYLRMLTIHDVRSVLTRAKLLKRNRDLLATV